MMAGPKMTRRQAVQEAEEMRRARRNQMTQPQLTEPHSVGDGWAMQLVDVSNRAGLGMTTRARELGWRLKS